MANRKKPKDELAVKYTVRVPEKTAIYFNHKFVQANLYREHKALSPIKKSTFYNTVIMFSIHKILEKNNEIDVDKVKENVKILNGYFTKSNCKNIISFRLKSDLNKDLIKWINFYSIYNVNDNLRNILLYAEAIDICKYIDFTKSYIV